MGGGGGGSGSSLGLVLVLLKCCTFLFPSAISLSAALWAICWSQEHTAVLYTATLCLLNEAVTF